MHSSFQTDRRPTGFEPVPIQRNNNQINPIRQAKGFEPLPPVALCVTRNPQNSRACPQWHNISYSQGGAQVNQSLKPYTSPTLAFYTLHANQVTQMLSIKGIFSRSKLQTKPKARALSWGLAHSYNGGPKLVHYDYTVLFIYFMFYKLVPPNIVSFKLQGTFSGSCICHHNHTIAWHLLRAPARGQILVSQLCDIG